MAPLRSHPKHSSSAVAVDGLASALVALMLVSTLASTLGACSTPERALGPVPAPLDPGAKIVRPGSGVKPIENGEVPAAVDPDAGEGAALPGGTVQPCAPGDADSLGTAVPVVASNGQTGKEYLTRPQNELMADDEAWHKVFGTVGEGDEADWFGYHGINNTPIVHDARAVVEVFSGSVIVTQFISCDDGFESFECPEGTEMQEIETPDWVNAGERMLGCRSSAPIDHEQSDVGKPGSFDCKDSGLVANNDAWIYLRVETTSDSCQEYRIGVHY